MSSPRLTWLRIHKYRNVAPGFLEFGNGFNVLLGRNGTGKTTLLELIEMIWAKGFGRLADEPFHLEYAVEFDGLTYEPMLGEQARTVPGCTIEVTVENSIPEAGTRADGRPRAGGTPGHFYYKVVVTSASNAPVLVNEGNALGATLRLGSRTWQVPVLSAHSWPILWAAPQQFFARALEDEAVNEERDSDVSQWAEWCYFQLELINNEGRFDESLGAFHALTSDEYKPPDSGVPGVQWQLERRLDAETKVYPVNEQACAFVPLPLVHRWSRELSDDVRREPPEFRYSLREARSLKAFLDMTTYTDAIVMFRPLSRMRRHDVETLQFGTPEFRIMLPHDRGEINAQALSYGEKRLLAFLWYLACGPSVVIADELVNGFHHEWIERCVELIGERQAFLASQNPLLLDCLPLEDVEYVRRCFITCRRGPESEGQMRWSNISSEEAATFYAAYERETQYVHEILRGKGLW